MEWDRCWKGPCGEDSRAVMAYTLARSRCPPVLRIPLPPSPLSLVTATLSLQGGGQGAPARPSTLSGGMQLEGAPAPKISRHPTGKYPGTTRIFPLPSRTGS